DQDVDRLPCCGLADCRPNSGLVGDIGYLGEVRLACGHHLVQHRLLAAEHRDRQTGTSQLRRNRAADATAPACHQRVRGTLQSGHAMAPPSNTEVSGYILYLKLLQESRGPVSIAP